jgi:hypothetical protein
MKHSDDYDDTIRHTPGAFALMGAIFETAMLDAADPRYRLSALRWLLSEGAVWAVEFGGADPAAYRARLLAIKVTKPARVWIDDEHFLGPLCKRGHEYKRTGQTLRRQYKESSYCPACDRITGTREHKRRQERVRAALAEYKPREIELAANTYLGTLCKRGHDYEESGHSVRYRGNQSCVECSRGHLRKQYEKKVQVAS